MAFGKGKGGDAELARREIFYGGWGGMNVPRVPQEPLDEAEARAREAYYVGRYDGEGRLVSFEKFLNGERDWADEYSYWDNGKVKERVLRKADGSQSVQRFNRRGKFEQ